MITSPKAWYVRVFQSVLLTLALLVVFSVSPLSAGDTEKTCDSEKTWSDRPCTFTEELIFCLETALEAARECEKWLPWYLEMGCAFAFDVDAIACLPGAIFPPLD
jgi:hypothetical protein